VQRGGNGTPYQTSKTEALAILLGDDTINSANAIEKTVKESKRRIDAILVELKYIETSKVNNLQMRNKTDTADSLKGLTSTLYSKLKELRDQPTDEYCQICSNNHSKLSTNN
jgi:hypothetical protein